MLQVDNKAKSSYINSKNIWGANKDYANRLLIYYTQLV